MMQFENSSQAIYLQIVTYVCEQIIKKRWTAGDKIPSVRELGVNLEVNPNTVMRSYDVLKTEEIIFDKRGIGYFIAPEGEKRALAYLQKQFTKYELPLLFKSMLLLNMEPESLVKPFEAYKKKNGF